jgi:hypothetical protein
MDPLGVPPDAIHFSADGEISFDVDSAKKWRKEQDKEQ